MGFHVRLWGVHAKGVRAMPGCPRCREIEQELRRIADEVALSVRLVHREGYEQPVDSCEERCLKEIVARLRELGIPER